MRDYIAWYLIELRRRLRNVEPQQKVEDFLLETRTHLQESIDEMGARGIPEDAATKSAIADFGHPSLVAQAFRGRDHMSAITHWVLIGIVLLIALPTIYHLVSSATDNAMGYSYSGQFEFGWACIAILAGIAIVSFLSRKWSSLPITAVMLVITVCVSVWFMGTTRPYAAEAGSSRFFLLSDQTAKTQVAVREEWINRVDATVPKYLSALADKSAGSDERLKALVETGDGTFDMPMKVSARTYRTFRAPPMSLPGRAASSADFRMVVWLDVEESRAPEFVLRSTPIPDIALSKWKENGAAFLQQFEGLKAKVRRDQAVFRTPSKVAEGAVASRLLYLPVAAVFVYSLVGLLVNGLAIAAKDAHEALRRRGWKRALN